MELKRAPNCERIASSAADTKPASCDVSASKVHTREAGCLGGWVGSLGARACAGGRASSCWRAYAPRKIYGP